MKQLLWKWKDCLRNETILKDCDKQRKDWNPFVKYLSWCQRCKCVILQIGSSELNKVCCIFLQEMNLNCLVVCGYLMQSCHISAPFTLEWIRCKANICKHKFALVWLGPDNSRSSSFYSLMFCCLLFFRFARQFVPGNPQALRLGKLSISSVTCFPFKCQTAASVAWFWWIPVGRRSRHRWGPPRPAYRVSRAVRTNTPPPCMRDSDSPRIFCLPYLEHKQKYFLPLDDSGMCENETVCLRSPKRMARVAANFEVWRQGRTLLNLCKIPVTTTWCGDRGITFVASCNFRPRLKAELPKSSCPGHCFRHRQTHPYPSKHTGAWTAPLSGG